MEKTSTLLNNIYSGTNDYVRLQVRSAKLELYERITTVIESGISAAVILLFGVFSFLFINFGLAFWLGNQMESTPAGFFVVGLFYMVVLGLYLALKDRVAKNKVKNAVLLKVSKTHSDYEQLLEEQELLQAQVAVAEQSIVDNIATLKENIDVLKDDLTNLKEHFITGKGEGNERVGPKLPRMAITSVVDLLLQKVLFRKAGFAKKTVLPIIANALLTSTVFDEDKRTSLIENLKLKLRRFL